MVKGMAKIKRKEEGRRKKKEESVYFQTIKFDVGAKHSGDNLPLETKILCPNASPSSPSSGEYPNLVRAKHSGRSVIG
jgi:hypothetical protein